MLALRLHMIFLTQTIISTKQQCHLILFCWQLQLHFSRWKKEKEKFLKTIYYTAKLVPQPHVELAFGFLNVNPREFNPPSQSTSMPIK